MSDGELAVQFAGPWTAGFQPQKLQRPQQEQYVGVCLGWRWLSPIEMRVALRDSQVMHGETPRPIADDFHEYDATGPVCEISHGPLEYSGQ